MFLASDKLLKYSNKINAADILDPLDGFSNSFSDTKSWFNESSYSGFVYKACIKNKKR